MASDEIVWSVINQQFCSFKLKTTKDRTFCRNEYNVTGLCTRQSCPLANSRYATVRSNPETGQIYLFVKTIERSHMPNRWWQKIKLSKDYATALEQIDSQLIYWPKFLIHKCKQRLTRLHQVAIRTKRLLKEQERLGETLVPKLAPKVRRREETRERKAESAAKLERSIERVLMERLVNGTYGENPLNVEENVWRKVMKSLEKSGKGTQDVDLDDEEIEEEQEVELENEPDVEYVSDLEDSDADLQDLEDWIGSDEEDDEDEDEDEESDEEDGEEASDEDKEGDEDEDEIAALKKAISGIKRKQPSEPTPDAKARKDKKSRRREKGPKREIEYEIEREPAVRQTLHA